jgi:acetyltransferase-like isoleucine patch superfamily enzyme
VRPVIAPGAGKPSRIRVRGRIAWTVASLIIVQTIVCGLSALPVVLVWHTLSTILRVNGTAWWVLLSFAIAPSYVLFAVSLMLVSPIALRVLRWQTPANVELRLADMDWALLRWVRYGASIHLARIIAGTWFRGTPLWTVHLRLNGAQLGKRVFVNSLSVSDYNLIECGNDVVIGGGVHLSGHTVEGGFLKTSRVRLGDNVTIGLGSVIEIGVEVGSNSQVGALSFVPKFTKLAGGHVYAGTPALPLPSKAAAPDATL